MPNEPMTPEGRAGGERKPCMFCTWPSATMDDYNHYSERFQLDLCWRGWGDGSLTACEERERLHLRAEVARLHSLLSAAELERGRLGEMLRDLKILDSGLLAFQTNASMRREALRALQESWRT